MLRRPLLAAARHAQRSAAPSHALAAACLPLRQAAPLCMFTLYTAFKSLVTGTHGMGRRGITVKAAALTLPDADGSPEQQPRPKRARKSAAATEAPVVATEPATTAGVAAAAAAATVEAAAAAALTATVAAPEAPASPAVATITAAAAAATPRARVKKLPKAVAPSVSIETSLAQLQPKAAKIAELLGKLYPEPPVPLEHRSNFQLLCAVMMSAQTTDVAVNKVTPALFALAPDAASMAALDASVIADCIRTVGLAPTKAKNLKAMSQMLLDTHGGEVPDSFEGLEALPGVGHKTASVVMAHAFGHDAFPVDTHIHRLAQRWGLTPVGRSVEQTEADLKLLFPRHLWYSLHLQIIFFGREMCPAKSHDPATCPICSWAAVPPFDRPGASPVKANGKGSSAGAGAKTRKPRAATPAAAAGAKRGRKRAAAGAQDAE